MATPSRYTDKHFTEMLNQSGVDLPNVIKTLSGHLSVSKEGYQALGRLMDNKTRLTEHVKLLELELFITLLKKL
jgi:hypothetical protein